MPGPEKLCALARAAQHSGSQLHGALGGLRGHITYPILQSASEEQGWTHEPSRAPQKWMVPAPLHGRNTIAVSKALQVPLVGFPKGPWWSLSPPAQGSTPLSGVRLDPAWAGGGVCARGGGPRSLPRTELLSPSSPPLLLSGWQVSSCLPNCYASSETHPSPRLGSGKGPGQEPGNPSWSPHSAPTSLVTLDRSKWT